MAKLVHILLVEDNEDDVEITLNALKETKLANKVAVVDDGVKALAYLRKEGDFKDTPIPDIVVLDLNLPLKDGMQVLREMKEDKILQTIPVVVLTTSQAEEDIVKSYELHANCYISKPLDMAQLNKIVHTMDEFWFGVVQLPPKKQ